MTQLGLQLHASFALSDDSLALHGREYQKVPVMAVGACRAYPEHAVHLRQALSSAIAS
jgi:hypothetical protein